MLTHIDLFSGIGGFTRCLHGISNPLMYCEIDADARSVLKANMAKGALPTANIISDVRNIQKVPAANIVTAGWPCTGHSVAGKRDGFSNQASALFAHITDIASASQATLVILENVPAVCKHVVTFQIIQKMFESLGFCMVWTILPAYAVGLPHNRNRWFCVCFKSLHDLLPLEHIQHAPPVEEPALNGTAKVDALYWKRWKLLGLSMVPQCALKAIQLCVHHAINNSTPGKFQCVRAIHDIPAKPNLCLRLVGNNRVLHKPLWPSPRTNLHFSPVMTERTARDLQNAVKYYELSQGAPSIMWVEWLMGYPEDYTRF